MCCFLSNRIPSLCNSHPPTRSNSRIRISLQQMWSDRSSTPVMRERFIPFDCRGFSEVFHCYVTRCCAVRVPRHVMRFLSLTAYRIGLFKKKSRRLISESLIDLLANSMCLCEPADNFHICAAFHEDLVLGCFDRRRTKTVGALPNASAWNQGQCEIQALVVLQLTTRVVDVRGGVWGRAGICFSLYV